MSDTIRCDLCLSRDELNWTYTTPSEVETLQEAERTGAFWTENSAWPVCETCHRLIQAEEFELLYAHVLDRREHDIRTFSTPGLEDLVMNDERGAIRALLRSFWLHREPHPQERT